MANPRANPQSYERQLMAALAKGVELQGPARRAMAKWRLSVVDLERLINYSGYITRREVGPLRCMGTMEGSSLNGRSIKAHLGIADTVVVTRVWVMHGGAWRD